MIFEPTVAYTDLWPFIRTGLVFFAFVAGIAILRGSPALLPYTIMITLASIVLTFSSAPISEFLHQSAAANNLGPNIVKKYDIQGVELEFNGHKVDPTTIKDQPITVILKDGSKMELRLVQDIKTNEPFLRDVSETKSPEERTDTINQLTRSP